MFPFDHVLSVQLPAETRREDAALPAAKQPADAAEPETIPVPGWQSGGNSSFKIDRPYDNLNGQSCCQYVCSFSYHACI